MEVRGPEGIPPPFLHSRKSSTAAATFISKIHKVDASVRATILKYTSNCKIVPKVTVSTGN